jgi:hypothetical protein
MKRAILFRVKLGVNCIGNREKVHQASFVFLMQLRPNALGELGKAGQERNISHPDNISIV